jgi:hypothetical protein
VTIGVANAEHTVANVRTALRLGTTPANTRSGRSQPVPEVDRAEWFSPDRARAKILNGQRSLIGRLLALLSPTSARLRRGACRSSLSRAVAIHSQGRPDRSDLTKLKARLRRYETLASRGRSAERSGDVGFLDA